MYMYIYTYLYVGIYIFILYLYVCRFVCVRTKTRNKNNTVCSSINWPKNLVSKIFASVVLLFYTKPGKHFKF